MKIDLTRRRFLFGLAAVPLVVPAVKYFFMPRWEAAPRAVYTAGDVVGGHAWYRAELYRNGKFAISAVASGMPSDEYRAGLRESLQRTATAFGYGSPKPGDWFDFVESYGPLKTRPSSLDPIAIT